MKRMFRLLTADEIECRVSTLNERGLSLLLYKDARCDMNILDETVGAMNWQKRYSRDNANCEVGIYCAERDEWIWKEDTGTQSQTEAEKGLASDSFKRACFNWGIGRELYTAPFIWIEADKVNLKEKPRGGGKTTYDKFEVKTIGYDDAGKINALVIINKNKNNAVVYTIGKTQEIYTEQQGDEANAETVRKEPIGTTRAKALEKHISENGIYVDTIYRLYKVSALKDLSEDQHKNIVEHISDIKAEQEKAS